VNIKDLPKDAVLTSILLFIGASSAYIEVPLLALPLILLLPWILAVNSPYSHAKMISIPSSVWP